MGLDLIREKKALIIKHCCLGFILILLVYFLNHGKFFSGISAEDVKHYLESFGVLAPLIYILLFTFVPLTLFPDAVLAIAAGLVFGLYHGFIYTMIGAACGATLAFYIARKLGQGVVKRLIKHDISIFNERVEKNGFFIILVLRLIPLLPFDVISYSAGFSKIRYQDFLIGTLIGIIPGVFVYSNLGYRSAEAGSGGFYVSLSMLILMFAVSFILKKRVSLELLQEISKTEQSYD